MQTLSWRWIFGLMIPLVVLVLGVGVALVRNFEEPSNPYLDVPSIFLSAIGFSATLYGLAGFSQLADGLPIDRLLWFLLGVVVLFFFSDANCSSAANPVPRKVSANRCSTWSPSVYVSTP